MQSKYCLIYYLRLVVQCASSVSACKPSITEGPVLSGFVLQQEGVNANLTCTIQGTLVSWVTEAVSLQLALDDVCRVNS